MVKRHCRINENELLRDEAKIRSLFGIDFFNRMVDVKNRIERKNDLQIELMDKASRIIIDTDGKGNITEKYCTYYMELKITNIISKSNQTFKISNRYREMERLYIKMLDGKSLTIYLSISISISSSISIPLSISIFISVSSGL